jgi:hypothetical protein
LRRLGFVILLLGAAGHPLRRTPGVHRRQVALSLEEGERALLALVEVDGAGGLPFACTPRPEEQFEELKATLKRARWA